MISQYFTNPTISVVVLNRLRRCFAQFKLCVDLLQPRSERPRRTVNAAAVVSSTTSSLTPGLISRLNNHRALRRRLRRRRGWRQGQHYTGVAVLDLGENTVVDPSGGIGIAADDPAQFVDSIERSKRRARKIIDYKTMGRTEENAVRRARCV